MSTMSLPRTGQQQSALANFVQANEGDLINYIVQTGCPALVSAAGAAAGLPVPPEVSGIFCNFVGQYLGMVIDKCTDPGKKNREFRDRLGQTLATLAAHIPPLGAPPQPAPEELPLLRWAQVNAEWQNSIGQVGEELQPTWSQDFHGIAAMAPLVLPGPTLVTLRWFVSAGAGMGTPGPGGLTPWGLSPIGPASPQAIGSGVCEQDMATVKLLGQGGQVLFEKEVEGVFKVGQSESNEDSGSMTVELPAGNYLLVGAVSGPSGHAVLSADYMITRVELTVTEPPSPLGLLLMGTGAWMLATGGRR